MIYESICLTCGAYHEYVRPVAEYLNTPVCCGVKTQKRLLTPPMGIVDIPAYESPASGKIINSRAQRREDFKRTGTRPWEGIAEEKKEAARQAQYAEQKQDAAMEHTIRTTLQHMPESKKQALLGA